MAATLVVGFSYRSDPRVVSAEISLWPTLVNKSGDISGSDERSAYVVVLQHHVYLQIGQGGRPRTRTAGR